MRRDVGQVGDGDTFQDWFNNIPPITKVIENNKYFSGLYNNNYYLFKRSCSYLLFYRVRCYHSTGFQRRV